MEISVHYLADKDEGTHLTGVQVPTKRFHALRITFPNGTELEIMKTRSGQVEFLDRITIRSRNGVLAVLPSFTNEIVVRPAHLGEDA